MVKHSRYRWRTKLRGVLPKPLDRLVPKGHGDCGAHEWYRHTDEIDRCYHCESGVRVHDPLVQPPPPASAPWMQPNPRRRTA